MDEKRTDLKAALQELAAREPGDDRPHPGLKRLIAYRQGTLPAAEREALQEHLSLCTRCTRLLLELRDFEAASARGGVAGPESLRQEAWEAFHERLPRPARKTPAVRSIAGATRHQAPRLRPIPLFVAAAALLLAAGLAIWAAITVQQERQRLTRLEQRLDEREDALAGAQRSLAQAERQLAAARGRIQDLEAEAAAVSRRPAGGREDELAARVTALTSELEELRRTRREPERRDQTAVASREIEVSVAPRFALRGQEPPGSGFLRGGGAVNPVRPRMDRFTVSLSLADHPVYEEYRLELVDLDGKVLWDGRRPGGSLLGDAGTSVSVSGLGPGRYRLRIEGLHPDRRVLLGEYLLEVERQETPK